ncbi:recombinase family protein [Dyadobacter sp. CY261]|uniref:recombinase family protein n=1 Tax=Dyadobacter sp. CY261 TaxID=2907203 RepID=UPI001F19A36C|nr:recombinase family protein [Dyadobacter sp. CY261]MCF0072444.1 recombinase family protein [Dyadobacter sp. CY261]
MAKARISNRRQGALSIIEEIEGTDELRSEIEKESVRLESSLSSIAQGQQLDEETKKFMDHVSAGGVELSSSVGSVSILMRTHGRRKKPLILDESLSDVKSAIIGGNPIAGYNLVALSKDPDFRFITKDKPAESLEISSLISATVSSILSTEDPLSKSILTRTENADQFAKTMHEVVAKIHAENPVKSYRVLAEALNNLEIPTYRGGNWHLSTVQNLYDRWKKLGLTPPNKIDL